MGLRTIVLKIYRPSRSKREILDEAIRSYNMAFRFLLERAYEQLEYIQEKYAADRRIINSNELSKWVGKELSDQLNAYDVQPFKDSLKMELGMTLAGYFNLKAIRPETGFPLLDSNAGIENRKPRPVFFCRYDTKRSYCLLYDREKDRYYAKLYLMNRSKSRSAAASNDGQGKLTYIHRQEDFLESRRKKETFIVVPLAFGKYQEQFLQKALEKPEILRTAKLDVRNGEFYLSVSIDIGEAEKVKTDTFLGVARGLKNDLNFTVVDANGQLLVSEAICRNKNMHGSGSAHISELHRAANRIVELAKKNKSQVIMQNLFEKGDRINWIDDDGSDRQPSYKCGIYNELIKLLDYKLPEHGLPAPVKVSSVDIFYRCHSCGCNSRRNRLTRDMFICTVCGETMEVEKLGSLNLAKKLIDYNNSTIKIKVSRTSGGVWFTNSLLELDYFVPYDENPPEKLREELKSIISDIKNSIKAPEDKNMSRKLSIIKKFESKKNFMSLIEFV